MTEQAKVRRKVGLARALSKLGYCSRSRAFDLIGAGQVLVNGRVERNPERPTDLERDKMTIGAERVDAPKFICYLVNKPRGMVTTARDERGRETVYSLLPPDSPWVGPVGRLDKASEGLLLLTNDSEWAARITDPGSHLDKKYHVHVAGIASETLLQEMERGVQWEGERLRAKRSSILRRGEKNTWLEVVLDEGKNRQIRRMLEALGVDVLRLVRVAIGPLNLGDLVKGGCRMLTDEERLAVDRALYSARGRH